MIPPALRITPVTTGSWTSHHRTLWIESVCEKAKYPQSQRISFLVAFEKGHSARRGAGRTIRSALSRFRSFALMSPSHIGETAAEPSDHPRGDGNFPQQDGQRPAHKKRAGEYDREFDECREGWIVNDVLQPDKGYEVQEVNAVGRGPHRVKQTKRRSLKADKNRRDRERHRRAERREGETISGVPPKGVVN